jgi:hypothetical protein
MKVDYQKVLRVLRFLRIADDDGNLSVSNLAVIGTLAYALTRPEIDLNSLLAFVTAAVGYQVRRGIRSTSPAQREDLEFLQEQVKKLESRVTAVQLGKQFNK